MRAAGVLFGAAAFPDHLEALGQHGFEILDKHWQIYRKQGEARTSVDMRRPAAAG